MKTFLFSLLLLVPSAAFSQCTLWNSTGCDPLYPATTNPAYQTYVADTSISYNSTDARETRKSQPKILMTGQAVPCSGAWLGSNVSGYGPYCNSYLAAMHAPWPNGAGVSTIDINVAMAGFACDPSYAGFPGAISNACDSFTGAAFAYGAIPPPGTLPNTRAFMLYWTDQAVAYSLTHGITLRFGVFPSSNTLSQLSASPPSVCSIPVPISSEPLVEGCVKPLMQAFLTRYGGLIANLQLQVVEEPTGGMIAIGVHLTVAQISTLIQNLAAAAVAIDATVQIGAAALGSDSAYWLDWTASGVPGNCISGTSCFVLNFLVLDIFTSSCDPSSPTYSTTLTNFAVGFLPDAIAVSKPIRIGQSDAPIFCEIGSGTPSQANSLIGQSDSLMMTTGVTVWWLDTFYRWASAEGIEALAMFVTTPLFCTGSLGNDNGVPGTAFSLACVQNLVPTVVAQEYSQLSLHGAANPEQGYALTTGYGLLTGN